MPVLVKRLRSALEHFETDPTAGTLVEDTLTALLKFANESCMCPTIFCCVVLSLRRLVLMMLACCLSDASAYQIYQFEALPLLHRVIKLPLENAQLLGFGILEAMSHYGTC